jgi:hypothetical protein
MALQTFAEHEHTRKNIAIMYFFNYLAKTLDTCSRPQAIIKPAESSGTFPAFLLIQENSLPYWENCYTGEVIHAIVRAIPGQVIPCRTGRMFFVDQGALLNGGTSSDEMLAGKDL